MELLKKIFKWFIAIFCFLIIWEIISIWLNNIFFPTPIKVFLALFELFKSGIIFYHILASLKRTLIGFSFALVIASLLGYIVGSSKLLKTYFTPILELLRPIPPIAWIPLAILWFGIGDASSSFIIFIAAFFPIFTNVYFGVTSIPNFYYRISKNYNLGKFKEFTNITFPYTLPYLITGSKTSLGFGWMAVIAAEMIAGNYGLGYFLEVNRSLLKTEYVISTMIIIGVIGFLLNKILNYAEIKATAYRN